MYPTYVDYIHVKKQGACDQAGGFGRADEFCFTGAGDRLVRRILCWAALFAPLSPAMGFCIPGCVLLARLRPLVRVAGGPGGMRELSAPHISLKMRVASTSLPPRAGSAGGDVVRSTDVTAPLSGWEFWGVGGMTFTLGGGSGGEIVATSLGGAGGSAAEVCGTSGAAGVACAAAGLAGVAGVGGCPVGVAGSVRGGTPGGTSGAPAVGGLTGAGWHAAGGAAAVCGAAGSRPTLGLVAATLPSSGAGCGFEAGHTSGHAGGAGQAGVASSSGTGSA